MNKFIKAPCYSIEQLNYLIESPTQCQQLFKIIFIRRGSLSLARLDVVALSQQQIISYQYHVNVASLFFKKLTFFIFAHFFMFVIINIVILTLFFFFGKFFIHFFRKILLNIKKSIYFNDKNNVNAYCYYRWREWSVLFAPFIEKSSEESSFVATHIYCEYEWWWEDDWQAYESIWSISLSASSTTRRSAPPTLCIVMSW